MTCQPLLASLLATLTAGKSPVSKLEADRDGQSIVSLDWKDKKVRLRCKALTDIHSSYYHRTFSIHRFNMHPIGTTFTPLDCSLLPLPSVWICGRTASSPSILKTLPRLPILSVLYILVIIAPLLVFLVVIYQLFYTTAELETLKVELSDVKASLAVTTHDLFDVTAGRDTAKVALEASRQELKDTKLELRCTRLRLTSTEDDLEDSQFDVRSEQSALEAVRAELEFTEAEVRRRDRELEEAEALAERKKAKIVEQEKELLEARRERDDAARLRRESEVTLETTQKELRSSWEAEMKSKVRPQASLL